MAKSMEFSDEEMIFFLGHIKSLPPRKTEKPGTEYESHIAGASYQVSPRRDAIIVDWGYYHFFISLLKENRDKDEWGVSRDCRFLVFVEHEDGFNDHIGTVMSTGGYVTKESCWRGVVARTRRILK